MKITILRRLVQFGILALFIAGNIYGVKILQGSLSSSTLLNTINLSDPFAVLQLFLASFSVSSVAITGAFIVLIFYALIAPRAFCGWVCPVNILTDCGAFLRTKLKIGKNILNLSPNLRYYLLVLSLIFSAIFGIAAFESVSFVGGFTRGVVYLGSSAISIAVIIIAIETFVGKRLICAHICPLGAFYAIVSKFSLIRVKYNYDKCSKCFKCKVVCPEEKVLDIVGTKSGIISSECISCGKCVEVCNDDAINFSILKLGVNK
ncbi:menaquinol dehydrogenase NapGH, membrane component NapH [Campylobacter iguaniorum]|uniref:Menaquinol dehydrogenase NapGH, membrane component NapH n=1 Tax=Campylobacter iguaniorum TaxID=1244531 RepID=A0A076FBG8_9BACT|nr:quinol dehydrogenase ferredoxin subunit NapH [Campylobacter iguaniorum]AII15038.1 menaquinol dehydrogenase NapGH, membrane component NapH [Campylobacter iguaniorum]ALV24865.1 menaquinol dehydrogenase NapGH, membrane component NapH [Campylobacter iguaniorum]ANE36172.1 menaquinol dehydrogenase NapGH, membrane component NapH [Campylobacter iguaniorum]